MSASVFSTLSGVLTGKHPELGILCRETGEVLVPASAYHKEHWTFGSHSKSTGYMGVQAGGRYYLVHRLIAQTFLDNPDNKLQVDHRNRDRAANFVGNLRWSTPSENNRNTPANDRVEARGGIHWYEDRKQYKHEHKQEYYARNHGRIIDQMADYRARMRKTHKPVQFSDGSKHLIPIPEAIRLLAIPLKERHYGK